MKNVLFLFILALSTQLMAQTIMNIHQSNGTVLQIPVNTIDSITYTNSSPGNLATITTAAISSNTGASAVSGGNISSNGGSLVTQRGIVWSTSPNPTTANNSTNNGSGTGSFTGNLTGLTVNTTYYVRAYAINSAGTAYGNQVSFTTSTGGGTGIVSNPGPGVTYNGYNYPTIILGNGQEWMAENLRTTSYSNGDPITNVTINTQWQSLTTGAWCHYNDSIQYENPYGKLYNWYVVSDVRNVCPSGWHVPTLTEWTDLIVYLGGWSVAGGKMKSVGIQYWAASNNFATNESGFNGLPGGGRFSSGLFGNLAIGGNWWSTTFGNPGYASHISLYSSSGGLGGPSSNKYYGLSVRCLRD
jgi:uncharacterized protein (TIGR02145 family)